MARVDCVRGDLPELLVGDTVEVQQPMDAVDYRDTALASPIASFLDCLGEQLAEA